MVDILSLRKRVNEAQKNFESFGGIHWYANHSDETMKLLEKVMKSLEQEREERYEELAGEDI